MDDAAVVSTAAAAGDGPGAACGIGQLGRGGLGPLRRGAPLGRGGLCQLRGLALAAYGDFQCVVFLLGCSGTSSPTWTGWRTRASRSPTPTGSAPSRTRRQAQRYTLALAGLLAAAAGERDPVLPEHQPQKGRRAPLERGRRRVGDGQARVTSLTIHATWRCKSRVPGFQVLTRQDVLLERRVVRVDVAVVPCCGSHAVEVATRSAIDRDSDLDRRLRRGGAAGASAQNLD